LEEQWRGINCSDAVGEQNSFKDIMTMLSTKQNVSEVRWDDNMLSPYFNIRVNGTLHQVWYEDARSLAAKYALANDFGIAGVGVWTFDQIPSLPDQNAKAMWGALRGAVAASV
jgi:spore germination protein YaaH